MLHYFINMGIEGSGHHAVMALWSQSHVSPVAAFNPDVFVKHAASVRGGATANVDDVHLLTRRLLQKNFTNNTLFGADSYPEGRPFQIGAHPSGQALRYLPGIRFSFIFLSRNLTDAAISAERRFGLPSNNNTRTRDYARLQQELECTKTLMRRGEYVELRFEWICDDPRRFTKTLAAFVSARMGTQVDFDASALKCAARWHKNLGSGGKSGSDVAATAEVTPALS